MRCLFKVLPLAGAAFCMPAPAAGTVNVTFEKPENFQDASRDYPRQTDQSVLDALAAYIKEQAAPLLDDDQTLDITITEINLAGEFRPYTATQQMVRTLTEVTWPQMTLEYTLREGGEAGPVQKVQLADMNYRQRVRAPSDDEPLYYDKKMLDEWIRKTFGRR
ncbi:MAG: DUF3016 domain-containing protein [Pseudomonadota bacterium]